MAKAIIQAYFHCKKCLSGQLAVGWTEKGLQAFCEKCQLSVANLDFKGQKIAYLEEEPKNG